MSNRKVVIANCADCPFFDNEYYEYEETCTQLRIKIVREPKTQVYPIPECCPLTKTEEEPDGY